MMARSPQLVDDDEVQIFSVSKARDEKGPGRVDMATSPNSYIAVFTVPPRGGETHIHQHPDSDQILFILDGECTVEGVSGKFRLTPNEGVLIPAGVHYGFTNTAEANLTFLSMRSEATGGRRVAYVPNDPSGVIIRVPQKLIGAKGFGTNIFAYAFSRKTLGISAVMKDEWNKGCLLRMSCNYSLTDDDVLVNLPTRIVQWYELSDVSDNDYRLLPDPEETMARLDLTPLIQREAARASR